MNWNANMIYMMATCQLSSFGCQIFLTRDFDSQTVYYNPFISLIWINNRVHNRGRAVKRRRMGPKDTSDLFKWAVFVVNELKMSQNYYFADEVNTQIYFNDHIC